MAHEYACYGWRHFDKTAIPLWDLQIIHGVTVRSTKPVIACREKYKKTKWTTLYGSEPDMCCENLFLEKRNSLGNYSR